MAHQGAKAAKVTSSVTSTTAKATSAADSKRVTDLSTDMKAVTMATADSKEVTPRGGSSKVREHTTLGYMIQYNTIQ